MKNVYQVNFTLDQLNAAITALDTRARQKMEILEECKKSKSLLFMLTNAN